ncbi:MAG: Flp family type IVb pilin [Methylocella sp.]
MRHLLRRFINDQSGVTAIEYGLIASLIAVATIAAVSTLGTNLQTVFTQIAGSLT